MAQDVVFVGKLYTTDTTGNPPGIWGGGNVPMPTPPIYLPPPQSPGVPTHPIYYPPGTWGGSGQPFPTPPINIPPPTSPGVPTHPIYYPPGIWGGGNQPFPTPPIYLPVTPPGKPTHPIVLPPGEPTHPIVIPDPPSMPVPGAPSVSQPIIIGDYVLAWVPAEWIHPPQVDHDLPTPPAPEQQGRRS